MGDKILVTGAAGFIGFHVVKKLLKLGYEVVGVDNLNEYYDVKIKHDRLRECGIDLDGKCKNKNYRFIKLDIVDRDAIAGIFKQDKFSKVVHLAGQAGVRYSINNPYACVESNILGTLNILECCRYNEVRHLVFASSSSVYGGLSNDTDRPASVYAATKRSNELMAYTYSNLYRMPITAVRFFTVYGEWGRPDMAYYSFTRNILAGAHVKLFNRGEMSRDFTYIGDAVRATCSLVNIIPTGYVPYAVYDVGRGQPVELRKFLETIERCVGIKAKKTYLDMQLGDVVSTCADAYNLRRGNTRAIKI